MTLARMKITKGNNAGKVAMLPVNMNDPLEALTGGIGIAIQRPLGTRDFRDAAQMAAMLRAAKVLSDDQLQNFNITIEFVAD
jgi:hypothetical protein